jgi:DNA primase
LTIEEIKNSNPIEVVIGEFTSLKSVGGGRMVGLCPLHNEKTPSFHVDLTRQRFKCFGCGAGGDVIEFIQQYYNLKDFSEALSKLHNGADSPQRQTRVTSASNAPGTGLPRASITDCMTTAELELYYERAGIAGDDAALQEVRAFRLQKNIEVFEELERYCNLNGWDAEAICYLRTGRAFADETIEHFRYYNIKDYYAVNNHMKKVFKVEQLQKSGIYNCKEDGSSNLIFYQHRIVIPYLDYVNKHSLQPVYLRGRFFIDGKSDPKSVAKAGERVNKYMGPRNDAMNLNSPKRLYNKHIIKNMFAGESLYLVEGEPDAAAIHQMGFKSASIPGGGNLPGIKDFEDMRHLKVIYCGDADAIGNKVLTGDYVDSNGNARHTNDNLQEYFKWLNKDLFIKRLPSKDANDFLKECA